MHYEVPSLSSSKSNLKINHFLVLYEYSNKEHDTVKRAFRVGNWQSLRTLPNEMQPFCVS